MDGKKILFADDDPQIREALRLLLNAEGYETIEASCGKEVLQLMDHTVDLVILDVMMPEMNGYSVCAELRKRYTVPVMFLTAKSQDSDKTLGFSSGGDDYLVKPFSYNELINRVKAILRRYYVYGAKTAEPSAIIHCCGNIEIDTDRASVKSDGKEVILTNIEYRILLLLATHRQRIYSAQSIYEIIWNEPYTYSSTNTVMVHIRNIRRKLGDDSQNSRTIRTVWGKGYSIENRISGSLKLQLFCAVLLSLLLAFAVFNGAFLLGSALLDRTIYGQYFAKGMAEQQFSKLQEYVTEEGISLDSLQKLNVWCSRSGKIYLTIYKDDVLIYESSSFGKTLNHGYAQNFDPDLEDAESEYALVLQDGEKLRAFLYYYAGDAFYFGMTALAALTAFLAFSLCFGLLIGTKVAYIGKLKQELDILSAGQLEYEVTINGDDELGELAAGIDQMRRSMLKHQEIEKQMRSANSELITAMSHDLRTPLTSLLAYLEIIERKKYSGEEQMQELIHKCVGQTMRIKNMADKLFAYFLAYAVEWEDAEREMLDADQLFEQILGDYAYSLESKGLKVECNFTPVAAKIRINPELLQRALDNLYSNILKYADYQEPVQIAYAKEGNNILITLSNTIGTNQEKNDSTGIGLITCRRIVEYHKGCFTAVNSGNIFQVTIALPLEE